MSGLEIILIILLLVCAPAAAIFAVLLSRAKEDVAQSSQAQTDLVEQIRSAAERENQLKAKLDKAISSFNALRDQAKQKLTQAAQLIEQWKARFNKISHWESVENNVEKAKEIEINLASLNRKVEALRNVIEGYGSQYIVPPRSILDELAKEAAHTDAGQKLKAARTYSRQMVRDDGAATCDYGDEERSEMAANFVLDAFNGKAEAILSDVKTDNIGTLIQKLQDAFLLVNEQGVAFRNARILPNYLKARLEELKWAALVQKIKQEEREEQKQLKEQMREEAKAQREFERIEKESKKKEEEIAHERQLIQAAQLKAELEQRAVYELKLSEELKRVSEEKRVAYEARFREEMEQKVTARTAEYSERLADADAQIKKLEELREKAKSNAQLMKKGTVYIISNIGSFGEGIYKIGQTRRTEPQDRIDELSDASVPFDFDVHALIPTPDAPSLERKLHEQFVLGQVNKMNWRKEYFRVTISDIKKVVEEMGYTADWTMMAAATQFRETQVLELSLKNDSDFCDSWVRDQRGEKLEQRAVKALHDQDGLD